MNHWDNTCDDYFQFFRESKYDNKLVPLVLDAQVMLRVDNKPFHDNISDLYMYTLYLLCKYRYYFHDIEEKRKTYFGFNSLRPNDAYMRR